MAGSLVGPDEQAQTLIDSLDLNPIKNKLLNPEHGAGWSLQKVEDVEGQYRRFLFLNYKYPERQIVPSKEVDDFWHCHILDTRKYANDCERIFGCFLHHFPYFGMRGEDDARNLQEAFRETNGLLNQTFGQSFGNSSTSHVESAETVCSNCSGCSQCSSGPAAPNVAVERPRGLLGSL